MLLLPAQVSVQRWLNDSSSSSSLRLLGRLTLLQLLLQAVLAARGAYGRRGAGEVAGGGGVRAE